MDRFYIDVAPLQESDYTGIPQVAAKLAEMALGDSGIEPAFFYNRHEVPVRVVEHLLEARNGQLMRWASERYVSAPLVRAKDPGDRVIALHTNMKFARRIFPVEGQIVHDLTTVVTPHFHTDETNRYHVEKFYGDLHSNDVTFCVSESTATDVRTFYPGLPGQLLVSHLGVDWSHIDPSIRDEPIGGEKFILVLGTLEPRKNVKDVLKLLAEQPQLARSYRFIFGGRVGWGNSFEDQVETYGLQRLYDQGRIFQTGFISETAKFLLFKNASAVIYPSVYEGFGLPVAEAVSLGVPVVTTPSSSIPEVGQDFADYFLPGNTVSLASALKNALGRGRLIEDDRLAAWRNHFSWSQCYSRIRDALLAAADAKAVV